MALDSENGFWYPAVIARGAFSSPYQYDADGKWDGLYRIRWQDAKSDDLYKTDLELKSFTGQEVTQLVQKVRPEDCSKRLFAARLDKDAMCPQMCPFWSETKFYCSFKCVGVCPNFLESPAYVMDAKENSCKRCGVRQCKRCASTDRLKCETCLPGYKLDQEGAVCSKKPTGFLSWLQITMVTAAEDGTVVLSTVTCLLAIIVAWYVDMRTRGVTNTGAIEAVDAFATSQRLLRKGADSGLYPMLTNLQTQPVAGLGLMFMMNFQCVVILLAALVLGMWYIVLWIEPELADLGKGEVDDSRVHCSIAHWGAEVQNMGLIPELLFTLAVYVVMFAFSLAVAALQRTRYLEHDAGNITMKDYAAVVKGVPAFLGEENAEEIMSQAIQKSTGQKVVGVSICWDFREEQHRVRNACIDRSLDHPEQSEEPAVGSGMLGGMFFKIEQRLGFGPPPPEAAEVADPVEVRRLLLSLKTSGAAFAVFETEVARDAAVSASGVPGGSLRPHFLRQNGSFETVAQLSHGQLEDQVLERQHRELMSQLEGWLRRLEAVLKREVPPERNRRRSSRSEMGVAFEWDEPQEDERNGARTVQLENGEIDETQDRNHSIVSLQRAETPRSEVSAKPTLRRTMSYEKAVQRGTRVETFKRQQTESEAARSTKSQFRNWWDTTVQPQSAIIADSLPFNIFFAFVIISNSVLLCFQLEMKAASEEEQPSFLAVHFVYAVLFTLEMLVRIMGNGVVTHFCKAGSGWNWLDVLVVVPAWVEIAIDLLSRNTGSEGGAASNLRIIRIFKITRLLQVVRSLRIVKFISALRALVMSVVDTTRQLMWALLLLGLVQYSFGLLFTDAVLDHAVNNGPDAAQMRYFGTVYTSVITLFRAILGGLDWELAADSLHSVGWVWVQVFHVYIAFCGFAVLNVMTGVFVNSAIKTREKDHETLMQNKVRFRDLVSKIWAKMDSDGLGQITITEFERLFDDDNMKAFFQAIEINAVDAWTLFDSLDIDGDHTISVDEFMERCMQLHGPARSVDLYAIKKQLRALEVVQKKMSESILPSVMRAVRADRDRDRWSCCAGIELPNEKATLTLECAFAEPDSVRWGSFGGGKSDYIRRWVRAICELTAVILFLMTFLKYPYSRYVMSFSYAETGTPNNLNGRKFLMLISIIANQVIYLFSDKVAEDMHFWYTEHKQKAYVAFYVVAMVLELMMMDLFFTATTTFNQLNAAGRRTYGGVQLYDLPSWHMVIETYVMQNALGNQLLDYAFPSTFIAPFLFEPILGFLLFHIGKLIVRSHSEISPYRAQKLVQWFWINDLSRYGDIILNLTIAVIFLSIHGGFNSRAFGYLLVCHLYIYVFDHWMLLRAMPRVKYNLMAVDTLAHVLMSIPSGMALCCVIFKANCKNMLEHPYGKLWPFPNYCVTSMNLIGLLVAAFLVHTIIHVLIVYLLMTFIRVKHNGYEVDYLKAAKTSPCTWFSANPVHCLRSEHLKHDSPHCRHHVPGREHLLRANEKIGCSFEDPDLYSVKYRGWHLLSNT
ncbi:unnamed protein product [Effrenium voratum]|uniref:EF-hand domain-containing protein n=1 Tax=Effrenium voratum TaxID=2562239 RepID=A0AA36I2Q4_9DINO|nr:unnamed protein product [Effrenium voratum]